MAVLALQGDFAAHAAALAAHGLTARKVRTADHLLGNPPAALVLPGGESTTMLRLLEGSTLADAILACADSGVPVFATCAGLILLAREVRHPVQRSLGLLNVVVERNSYGRQLQSAVVPVQPAAGCGLGEMPFEGVFIRAPRIVEVGEGVEVLAWRGADPVLVRQRNILAATFHPELSAPSPVTALFARMVGEAR